MKSIVASITTLSLFSFLTLAFAIETPRIVPRMDQIHKPADEVFATLKRYFSDPSSGFQLVSADRATHTLVAKETGISEEPWRRWAFCETGPVQMIYKLQDGIVTVTVKLEQATPHSTLASVAADFHGRYALGGDENTVACTVEIRARRRHTGRRRRRSRQVSPRDSI